MSPTQRTLQKLRSEGWTAEVVEKWIPRINVRKDLFNVIDIVACKPEVGTKGIQCTTLTHKNERIAKIYQEPKAAIWIASGNTLEVWGWRELKGRGKSTSKGWQVSITKISGRKEQDRSEE